MEIVDQRVSLITATPDTEKLIEAAGRTCYKSEKRITEYSAKDFVKRIIKSGHESVLEHASATVRFITNRGTTHELVRHRISSYSQESTRYCKYNSGDIQYVRPVEFKGLQAHVNTPINNFNKWKYRFLCSDLSLAEKQWLLAMKNSENSYNAMIQAGAKVEIARGVLPIDLKTEIVATYNMRQWRHVLKQRSSMAAHSQIRELMRDLLQTFYKKWPVLFDDIINTKE